MQFNELCNEMNSQCNEIHNAMKYAMQMNYEMQLIMLCHELRNAMNYTMQLIME